jgi:hypothetical protein
MLGLAGMAGADDLAKKVEGELNAGLPATNTLDCSGAIPIACGDLVSGDNSGGVSTADVYSCVGWNESGPDVVYELTLATDKIVTATISNMSADLDVFLLSACDENACLEYGNTSFTSECLTAGTYYIVVDGYNGAESAYDLEVTCIDCGGGGPENDTCEGAIDLCGLADGSGAFLVDYSTVTANNDYEPGVYPSSCTGFGASGGDVVYSVCLETGGTLDLTQTGTHDMALYLITDCADPAGTCLVGSDNCCTGADEVISYTNTGAPGTFYVIVDGYSSEGAGTVYGTVTGCCATATENSSWGEMKELFR